MRHRSGYQKIGRTSSHRKAMLRNIAISLLAKGRVVTTLALAREAKRIVERLITLGKNKSYVRLSNILMDKEAFKNISQYVSRYAGRSGGYTRIIKIGSRKGDGAAQAILEFVE